MQQPQPPLNDYFAAEAENFSGHFGLAAQRINSDAPILFHADDKLLLTRFSPEPNEPTTAHQD